MAKLPRVGSPDQRVNLLSAVRFSCREPAFEPSRSGKYSNQVIFPLRSVLESGYNETGLLIA